MNFGGGASGDFFGEDQVMEMEGFAKTHSKDSIQNTDQQDVFQTQRFARNDDMTIRIPVPDGIYAVTLLFAETYKPACTPGARVFDISLGTPVSGLTKVIDSFDVFQSAGCKTAFGKQFEQVPSKEGIVVHLTKKSQHPFLNGFIVEGFPVRKGDGSEFKTVGRVSAERHQISQQPLIQPGGMGMNHLSPAVSTSVLGASSGDRFGATAMRQHPQAGGMTFQQPMQPQALFMH